MAGYVWLYFGVTKGFIEDQSTNVCLIKHVTNIPCPSCGTSRSVVSLTKGNFFDAFNYNPFGYIVAAIMWIAPIWVLIDVIMKKSTLYKFYLRLMSYIEKPKYAVPLILIVLMNWIWNIKKGL